MFFLDCISGFYTAEGCSSSRNAGEIMRRERGRRRIRERERKTEYERRNERQKYRERERERGWSIS